MLKMPNIEVGNVNSNESPPRPANRSARRMARRRTGRVWLITLIIVAVSGVGGYAWWRSSSSSSGAQSNAPILHTVQRGPFDHVVLEDGEVESSNNKEVICQVQSRASSGTPILWVIEEGSYVKAGDKLVELDSSALQQEYKTQKIVVSSAEAIVIGSEAAVKQAEIAKKEYLEGTYLSEYKILAAEVAVAEQELKRAELSLASAERLAAKGTLRALQIQAEEFAVQNAKNKLESAQVRMRVLEELTKEKMLVGFESDIEAAKSKLASDQSNLIEEKDRLAELEQQMAFCIMTAPADGQVVHSNKFSSRGGNAEFVVEAGALVRERQTIIQLPDPNSMQVRAKINESRIVLVREGMPCKVRVGAVADELLGRVTKVNKYAEPGSWFSSSVKEYACEIRILNPPVNLRTGMSAEVRIFVAQLPDALQVPVHGVYEYRKHHFCLVSRGENYETREIVIGATNDKFVTIESGLDVGDQIVLDPRKHLDKMQLPDLPDEVDRDKLAEMGEESGTNSPVKGLRTEDAPGAGGPPGAAAGGPGMGGAGAGGPGMGGPGMGGPGAGGPPPISTMVDGMFTKFDGNSDGILSADELAAVDDRMKARVEGADTNGDGNIDKAELTSALEKMMSGAGR